VVGYGLKLINVSAFWPSSGSTRMLRHLSQVIPYRAHQASRSQVYLLIDSPIWVHPCTRFTVVVIYPLSRKVISFD